jgi:hypothetical protein
MKFCMSLRRNRILFTYFAVWQCSYRSWKMECNMSGSSCAVEWAHGWTPNRSAGAFLLILCTMLEQGWRWFHHCAHNSFFLSPAWQTLLRSVPYSPCYSSSFRFDCVLTCDYCHMKLFLSFRLSLCREWRLSLPEPPGFQYTHLLLKKATSVIFMPRAKRYPHFLMCWVSVLAST